MFVRFQRCRGGLARRSALHRPAKRGFTLIELVVVIGIIGILATLIFAVGGGVRERQNRTRAQADMATIANALEAFKARYGEYPPVANPGYTTAARDANAIQLYRALTGKMAYQRQSSGVMGFVPVAEGRAFLDAGRFTLIDTANPANQNPDPEGDNTALMDPWGRPYVYYFATLAEASMPARNRNQWQTLGFILLSTGNAPDARVPGILDLVPTDGILVPDSVPPDSPQLVVNDPDVLIYGR